jgi:hypothetical protein
LNDYQVFLKNRKSSGGGLMTAIDPNLNPMIIAPKLQYSLTLNEKQLRVINGYGPQDDDTIQHRLNFGLGLEKEIISAKIESCMIIIQMDANGKVGQKIISNDLNNVTDGNGLLNSDKKCVGSITRHRATKKSIETAVLDYVLVCQELYQYFEDMLIDEARQFTLTKYASRKGKGGKI